jgi:hypothetical protein
MVESKPIPLSDHERQLLLNLVLERLTRAGCAADPGYSSILRQLNGVDVVVLISRPA